jgi:hypothetical protein
MTEDDVARLERTLVEIHEHKGVLRRMKVFLNDSQYNKIAKLHLLSHWAHDTRQRGTADGCSTESPEHMHIQSKRAWRASNKVRPTPQMIKLIQRYEALRIHRARMNTYLGRVSVEGEKRRRSRVVYGEDEDVPFEPVWELSVGVGGNEPSGSTETGYADGNGGYVGGGVGAEEGDKDAEDEDNDEDEDKDQQHYPGRMRTAADARQHVVYPNPTLSIAARPTSGRVRGIDLATKYGATGFIPALHTYLGQHATRKLPPNFFPTTYDEYPVWHRLYLRHETLPFDPDWTKRDVIRARPADGNNECAFDVGLFLHNSNNFGIHRECSYHSVALICMTHPRIAHRISCWSRPCYFRPPSQFPVSVSTSARLR